MRSQVQFIIVGAILVFLGIGTDGQPRGGRCGRTHRIPGVA